MKNVFLSQGSQWTIDVEESVKYTIAEAIPNKIENINDIIISAKAGFINGVITAVEALLDRETQT